jgi:hypothetical protein
MRLRVKLKGLIRCDFQYRCDSDGRWKKSRLKLISEDYGTITTMEAEDQNCMQLQYMIRTVEWERG